jgi:DNA helicase-2/ATP-dependent DNA helicase PcrA
LVDDNKNYKIVDWRSPIASIFYDYEEGQCKIKTNSSILTCNLLNKRQFGIENGKLDYYIDTTINIEDEILQEALANNTTSQMKSIVQTIQREQNEIIRCDASKTLIVQGVAGSGKTAIALHRIAYLLYRFNKTIKSDNIKYISPNSAFSSYISSVLPDLAEEDVEKLQLDDIARKYLIKHLILERRFEQIERLICSQDIDDYNYKISYKFFQELLNFAYDNYINNFSIEDFEVKGKIISSKKIKDLFFGRYSDRDLFTRFKWITDNLFDTYFYNVKSPNSKIKIKEYIFRKLYSCVENKNCVKAYMNFLNSKNMKLDLVGNKVKNEDAYAILFFKVFIYGVEDYSNVKHLVIDEMQDYSATQIYIMDRMFNCNKTILGDFNQTINPNNVKSIQDDFKNIVNDDSLILTLNKSYRSTEEIANFYNFIGNKKDAKVVSRHGENVDFVNVSNKDALESIKNIVNDYKNRGFNSIAIITKSNKEAIELYSRLENIISGISLIDDNSARYDNNTCIISTFNSKGLEFDGVIVYNVSDNYSTDIDRNLLYISSTRALHKLTIMSIDKKCKFIEEYKEKL